MKRFISNLTLSTLIARANVQELPDYEPFLLNSEVSNWEVSYDDSIDLFPQDLNVDMSDECLSNGDVGDVGDINLFHNIARRRPRSQNCANPAVAAPPLPP